MSASTGAPAARARALGSIVKKKGVAVPMAAMPPATLLAARRNRRLLSMHDSFHRRPLIAKQKKRAILAKSHVELQPSNGKSLRQLENSCQPWHFGGECRQGG